MKVKFIMDKENLEFLNECCPATIKLDNERQNLFSANLEYGKKLVGHKFSLEI